MTGEQDAPGVGPVMVELTGITAPATFARLADALAASWQSVQALPLGSLERNWLREMLTGPGAQHCAQETLRQGQHMELVFTLAGVPHTVKVQPAEQEGA
ncbi:hypothetical protein ACIGXM_19665 [Kitasatospora sp. NPDC052896]|uniref:hypothetical protein n=1 Tax=Kitasatospora sp. NPDC052896 TaxID=3364061 RepID=UPI0037C92090